MKKAELIIIIFIFCVFAGYSLLSNNSDLWSILQEHSKTDVFFSENIDQNLKKDYFTSEIVDCSKVKHDTCSAYEERTCLYLNKESPDDHTTSNWCGPWMPARSNPPEVYTYNHSPQVFLTLIEDVGDYYWNTIIYISDDGKVTNLTCDYWYGHGGIIQNEIPKGLLKMACDPFTFAKDNNIQGILPACPINRYPIYNIHFDLKQQAFKVENIECLTKDDFYNTLKPRYN